MLNRYTHKKITWIDLESPTQDEIRQVMQEFGVHPMVATELSAPTLRPRVDLYPTYLYLILHFPAYLHNHGNRHDYGEQEVDFVVGKDFIITAHYEMIDPLHEFAKVFEVNSMVDRDVVGNHAGFIFFYIARVMYRSLGDGLDAIGEDLEEIEQHVFEGHEREMVLALSGVNRDLLNFRQSIRLHKDILESLEISGDAFFGEKFSPYLHSLSGEYYRVASELENHRETLLELRNTNDSLLTTKQNETMKFFTILAFVMFPMSFLATLFGMNTQHNPILGSPGDFWIIVGIMVSLAAVMFFYFRNKHWL
ncbi:MAG: magnesium transporter CorA family protein [Candidatus Yonathbacteria bacterium]|nr:magnesium transporter CorA family protein [Candidatus Yonathbacteria bacterium]